MSQKLQKILVAIDLSEPSLNAFHTASCLADKHGADLYVVHADDRVLESIVLPQSTAKGSSSNAAHVLSVVTNDINQKWGKESMLIEAQGAAAEIILQNAVKYDCDLIVIGSSGQSGYRKGYIGVTAQSVIKFAPCPVLLIPPHKKWSVFKRPLFPVRPVMTALRHYRLIKSFIEPGACMSILGLSSSEKNPSGELKDLVDEMQSKLLADNFRAEVRWNPKNSIPQTVLEQAEKDEADLVVVPPAIDVSLKPFYIGPNAHQIINDAQVPLLIISRINKYASAGAKVSL